MFSETDSTRQPAERSTKTDQQTQQAQDLTKCPIIDPCFSPRGSLDSGGGTSQTPQRVYEGLTHHRLPGSASTPCGGDISGRAFHLQRQQSRRVIPPPLQRQAQTPSSHTKEMQAPGCEHNLPTAVSIIPPPAGPILFPETGISPALLSRKYARRQRMTAWWQMTRTFSCLSSSMMTGSRRCTRSW